MDSAIDRSAWHEFVHPAFQLRLRYPAVTPLGQVVNRVDQQNTYGLGVHLTTPDRFEVYVEVVRFVGLAPRDEYQGHRAYLEERFGAGAITELSETSLAERPAWAYTFQWDQGERAVRLLPVGQVTYRIITNPRSPLNAEILATVTIIE